MKLINRSLACLLVAFVSLSCTQENDLVDQSASLVSNTSLNAKEQVPNPLFDSSVEGMYHGVVASASTQSRGKIWVNVGNNSNFNAIIELVDGSVFEFNLDPDTVLETSTMTVFHFESSIGSFTIDLGEIESPEISNIVLQSESFFGRVVKSMSSNMASSVTATFSATGNPGFSGTWNLIADGSNANPNGENGDGITSLLITLDGVVYEDFEFSSFNATTCFGIPSYVPTLSSFETPEFTICDYQTSVFNGGTAKWTVSYDPDGAGYMNYLSCETATAGTFDWTSADGITSRIGEIVVD